MLRHDWKFMPNPAIFGFVTRTRIFPAAKSSIARSLCSGSSLPLTSTAPSIAAVNASLSSFRSHHTSHCSPLAFASSAAFATRSPMLARRAFLRSASEGLSTSNRTPAFSGSALTKCSKNWIGGSAKPSSANPMSLGLRSITLHEQTHFQKSRSACPLIRHCDVSPPS